MKFHVSALCVLATLAAGCAATSVKKTWKSPDFHGPVGKIAVLTIDKRAWLREGFENRLVEQLTDAGAHAQTSFNVLTLDQIHADKRAAADRLRADGVQGLLILRLVGKTSSYQETRVGSERWATVGTGYDTLGWYDYYNVGFMDMSPTYASLTDLVSLETVLYDLKGEKRLWSGITETVVHDETDRLAEVDRLVKKIVSAMRRDGVLP